MISKEKLKQSKTFCMLPFMHIYGTAGGNLVPCCEAQEIPLNKKNETAQESWNNENYRELRRALTNDERPERCSVCWQNEDSGIVSNRQQWEDDNWHEFADVIEVNNDFSVNNSPKWIELKVSNFCNLKCIMCSTHSSYKRVQDLDIISKYQKDGHETKLLRPTTLFESLNKWPELWEHVHTLQFTGGEPIINKEHYDLLDSIPTEIKKRIALRYASNLSYIKFKKYDLVKIWNEFKSVNIKISMDGVNDVYNYIRQDGNFKTVHANMLALQSEPTISLAIGITVQAHNVYHMPEFYKFWKDSDINLSFITANILQTPRYLTPSLWPAEYRTAIITKLKAHVNEHPGLQRCISYMESNEPNIRDYAKMRKYTRDLEERYAMGTSIKDMVKEHLGMTIEGMDNVHNRLMKENNNEE